MQISDVIIFFELRTIQQETVKPTYLCPLGARKLAAEKSFSWHLTDKDKLAELFSVVLYVARKR